MTAQTGVANHDAHHEAGLRTFNASHIALWSPPVALAVADWLDVEAKSVESDLGMYVQPEALVVADLILGGAR